MKHLKQAKPFKYRKSCKMIYWGCQFDSLLELKYAISIQDEYEFIRSRLTIYYKHDSNEPTNYIREGVRHYTPDFIIRNKKTSQAYLIEIKPRAAQNEPSLKVRQDVAEKYIRCKKYDWTFKIVYDDEIVLDELGIQLYEECCKLKCKSAFKMFMQDQERKYRGDSSMKFGRPPTEERIRFVFLGIKPGQSHVDR